MKRELLIPLAAAAVAIAFLAVCVLVTLTRNHPTWVRRKLKVGALLISLTPACGEIFGGDPTCYGQVPNNEILVEGVYPYDDPIRIDLATRDSINAAVSRRDGEQFSYRLTDPDGAELYRGDLDADDGAFDEPTEEFTIPLASDLVEGTHVLEMFDVPADEQLETRTWRAWDLELHEGGTH